MTQKKSKFAKVFIFLTLIFIVFASFAVYIVMYAGFKGGNDNRCKSGYIRDEEIQDCVAETIEENIETPEINDEESCTKAGGTWYEENGICIGGNETNEIEDTQEEIEETTEENPKIYNPYIHYEDESEYCNMSFRTKKEAKGCKNRVEKTGHPPYIDCRAVNRTKKERNLCKRAKEAGYPYIAY